MREIGISTMADIDAFFQAFNQRDYDTISTTNSSPRSWNRMVHLRNSDETGPG